jgi:hypothetical protein
MQMRGGRHYAKDKSPASLAEGRAPGPDIHICCRSELTPTQGQEGGSRVRVQRGRLRIRRAGGVEWPQEANQRNIPREKETSF